MKEQILKIIAFLSAASQLSLLVILLINCYGSPGMQVHNITIDVEWLSTLVWNATVLIPTLIGCAASLIPFRKGFSRYSGFQRCFLYGTITGATFWLCVINAMPKD